MNTECNNELTGKQRTFCSDRCRKAATRTNRAVQPGQMSDLSDLEPTRTNLEQCRYCDAPLPPLAKPRRWPGACYECAIKQPRRPSVEALGELVYAGSEYKDIT